MDSAPSTPITTFTQAQLDAGQVIYFHDGSDTTSDSFNFTVSDGSLSDTGTFNLTVTAVNDAVVAVDDSSAFTVAEDGSVNFDVLGNDTDSEGDTLTITHVDGQAISVGNSVSVSNGSVTLEADGTLTFTADADYNGPISFEYSVSDRPTASGSAGQSLSIESSADFGSQLFSVDLDSGEKTLIGDLAINSTAMAYDAASDMAYFITNDGGIYAWDRGEPTSSLTLIGNIESTGDGWTAPVPSAYTHQTAAFYNGSLYLVPTARPAGSVVDDALYRVDFSDSTTISDVVKVANLTGDVFEWNNNDDIAIDQATGILYGRGDFNDTDNSLRTSVLFSYDLNTDTYNEIASTTYAHDFVTPSNNPTNYGDFRDVKTGMAVGTDGNLYGTDSNGNLSVVSKTTGNATTVSTWQVQDSNGQAGGDLAAVTSTGAISHGVVTGTVTAVNDAPVLDNSGDLTLPTITEDEVSNGGQTVAQILASDGGTPISDVDSGSVDGIAITTRNNGPGIWQYSIDGGTNWSNVGTVSDSSALLLRSTDFVRFEPNGENGTTKDFTFRAWDGTSGTAGSKVDASTNGGTTAFSTDTETASIVVTSVNDAPTINNGSVFNFTGTDEDTNSSSSTAADILTSSSLNDVDFSSQSGLAITSLTGNGTWQYSTDGSTWTSFGTVSASNALLISSSTQIRFAPDAENGETATFTYRAWDQTSGTASTNGSTSHGDTTTNGGVTAYSSETASAQIAVTDVNDAPFYNTAGDTEFTTITEDDLNNAGETVADLIASAGGNRITDVDNGAVEGIAIRSVLSGNGTWQYSLDGGTNWLDVGTVSNSSALLLRDTDMLRFQPNGETGTTAHLSVRAWDQTTGTAGTKVNTGVGGGSTAFGTTPETMYLTVTDVNDAPEVTGPATATVAEGGSLTFDIGGAGVIDTNDVDGDILTVTLTADHASIALAQTTGLTLIDNDGSDGTLQFSGSVASIDAALDGLTYDSQAGYNGSATLAVLVDDGSLTDSTTVAITVSPGQTTFIWDGGGATNDWSDADNWNHDLVPGADDIVVFNVTSAKDATLDAAFAGAVHEIIVTADYSGDLTFERSFNVATDATLSGTGTLNTAGFTLDVDGNVVSTINLEVVNSTLNFGGNVDVDAASSNVGGSDWVLDGTGNQLVDISSLVGSIDFASGGTVTIADTLNVYQKVTYTSGSVDFNGHTLQMTGNASRTIDAEGITFASVVVNTGGSISIVGDFDIDGDLTLTRLMSFTDGVYNDGRLLVSGDIHASDSGWTGDAIFVIDGTGDQTVTTDSAADMLRNVDINKASGTLTFDDDITFQGSFTYTTGTVDIASVATSFDGAGLQLDTAGVTFGDVQFANDAEFSLSSDIDIDGNLLIAGMTGNSSGGDLYVAGNVHSTDADVTGDFGIVLNGTSNQTISGADLTDGTVIIDKASGTASLSDDFGDGQTIQLLQLNSGTLDLAGFNVDTVDGLLANGGTVIGGGSVTDDVVVQNGAVVRLSAASTGSYQQLAVGGDLTLTAGSLVIDVTSNTTGGDHTDLVTYTNRTGSWTGITLTGDAVGFTVYTEYDDVAGEAGVFLNTAPTGTLVDVNVNEDAADEVIDLAAAFSDLQHSDGQLTYSIQSNNNASLFTTVDLNNSADTLTLDFADNLNGSAEIVVRATDPRGDFTDVTLTVSVASVNDAPVASDDTNTAIEDGASVGGTLSVTDNDPGDTHTFSLVSAPSEGSAVVNPDGTYTFDPGTDFQDLAAGETRDVTFVYRVTDDGAGNLTDDATVTITVTGTNDAPVAQAGTNSATEDGAVVNGTLTETDADTSDTHTYSLVTGTSEGTAVVNSNGSYTFDPGSDFQDLALGETRDVTFVYEVEDNSGATSQETITITVTGTNDAPVAQAGANSATEDGAVVNGTLTETDVDTNDTHTYSLVTGTSEGTAVVNSNGSYTFDPGSDFQDLALGETRDVTFVYEVEDNSGATSQETITITVTGTNDAPVAQAGTNSATEDGAVVNGTLTETDVDTNDTHTYSLVTGTSEGTAVVNSNGSYTFDPGSDFQDLALGETRDVTFVYEVEDNNGATSQETITVTVTGTNDAPVAQAGTNSATEDGAVVNGTLTETDADTNDTHTYSLVTGTSEGTAVVNSNGSYTFDPGSDFQDLALGETRDVTFVYEVEDNNGATSQETITITVTGTNDAPVAQAGTNSATEDGAVVNGTLTETDADTSDTHTYSLVSGTSEGTAVVNSNGSYTFDPGSDFQDLALGETRDVTFVYEVEDNNGATSQETITITVTGTNDAPVAQAGTNSATEDGAVVNGTLTETDVDTNDTHTYSLVTGTSEGTAVVNSNGSYTFDPGSDFQDLALGETRDVTFVYEVEDNNGATSQETITITVTGTNDAPVAQAGANSATEDGAVVNGTLTETDADTNDTHTYSLVTGTSEGTAVVNSNGSYTFDPGSDFQDLALGETRDVTFVYEVEDNNGATSQETITITVTGTNDAPVAQAGTNSATEDGAVVNGTLTETDVDTNDTHTYSLVTGTSEGTAVVNANGSYTFDAGSDFQDLALGETRDVTFVYEVEDNNGATSQETIHHHGDRNERCSGCPGRHEFGY